MRGMMELGPINAQIASAVANASAAPSAPAQGSGLDFAGSLDAALKAVSQSQLQSDEVQKQFALQNPNVGLEDAMVAMNKANISFAAAVQVRNRLVQAYDQIMQMPV